MDWAHDGILLLLVRNFVFGSKSYLPSWLIVKMKSNCWVRRARRARIRRLLTPEQEYGVRLTPESQVKSNCLSVATSDHGTHLATSSGIVTWVIFLRSRTPEYVAKSIAFFRLLFKSVEPWLAPDLLLDRLLEACDPSAVVIFRVLPNGGRYSLRFCSAIFGNVDLLDSNSLMVEDT